MFGLSTGGGSLDAGDTATSGARNDAQIAFGDFTYKSGPNPWLVMGAAALVVGYFALKG